MSSRFFIPFSFFFFLFLFLVLHAGGFLPWWLRIKNLPAIAGDIRDMVSILGSGSSPGGGHGNPLQYFCGDNPMNRGAWRAIVHGVAKSQTQLSTHTHTYTLCSKREFGPWLGALVDMGHKPKLIGRAHGDPSQTLNNCVRRAAEGRKCTGSVLCLLNQDTHISPRRAPRDKPLSWGP